LRVLADRDPLHPRARVARPETVAWSDATPIATLGDDAYAVRVEVGRGVVVAVANDDLFTNAGVLPRSNPAALVALARAAAGPDVQELRIALPEDGVTPPSNPFSALVAAGLGAAMVHALGASVLLFLSAGKRRTRPRAERGGSRRALLEHVEAIGALYARAGAASHALAAYRRFVELRRRGGPLPESGDDLTPTEIEKLRRLLAPQLPSGGAASATIASGTPAAPER
jgi:hypothetical protein